MPRSPWRFVTLLLAALRLAPGAAHVMELPAKMAYTPELYAAVTRSLYGLYGSVGAVIQVAALVCASVLAWRSRGRPTLRLALFGAVALAVSLLLWGAFVAPVNAEWARAIQSASEPLPSVYARLRSRWEYGHVAAFVAWLAGYVLLLLAVMRDARTAPDNPRTA